MNNPNVLNGIILLLLATVSVLLWWIYDQAHAVKRWREQSATNFNRFMDLVEKMDSTPPAGSVTAEIMQRVTDLENENATLRADVATGCRIIEQQAATITGQKDTCNRLVIENRRFLTAAKRK